VSNFLGCTDPSKTTHGFVVDKATRFVIPLTGVVPDFDWAEPIEATVNKSAIKNKHLIFISFCFLDFPSFSSFVFHKIETISGSYICRFSYIAR